MRTPITIPSSVVRAIARAIERRGLPGEPEATCIEWEGWTAQISGRQPTVAYFFPPEPTGEDRPASK